MKDFRVIFIFTPQAHSGLCNQGKKKIAGKTKKFTKLFLEDCSMAVMANFWAAHELSNKSHTTTDIKLIFENWPISYIFADNNHESGMLMPRRDATLVAYTSVI